LSAVVTGDGGEFPVVCEDRHVSIAQAVVYRTAELLAAATAARLVTRLVDAQAARGSASLVLTGGGTGIAVLEQLRAAPARDAIDWAHVDLYWGDERFLPAGHPERNETQARAALLDQVPVDPGRVHAMAASDGAFGDDPESAAAAYADLLASAAKPEDHGAVPCFDVCLLGVGGEGHVASVFPGAPAVYETDRTVVAVHGCPKPPPTRITLTLPAIGRAHDVWLMTTGPTKAAAVAMALGGAGEVQVPAAGAHGLRRTLWLLDNAAAAKIPGVYAVR
jgi:6-phosphogluconolactonase